MSDLPEKWLTVDPGEDTGYSIWSRNQLVEAGTEKMWIFGDAVWEAAMRYLNPAWTESAMSFEDDPIADALQGVSLIVVENWNIYPWVAKSGGLDWDECRTARLIGSLFQVCRLTGWQYEQQPAKIKERAVAAGAEAYFSRPLRENRHANDAIMHGVYKQAKQAGAGWADFSN